MIDSNAKLRSIQMPFCSLGLKASYALTGQASPTPGAVQSVINVTFSYN
ncbi:hypothetical protein PSJ70_10995 [Escherichia coli]|nr:hypothetical protein [Escherichia coli]MDC9034416.1 hypothetical protein [Escherichia coli]